MSFMTITIFTSISKATPAKQNSIVWHFLLRTFADGRFFVMTCDVMIFDSVIIDIIQNSQAITIALGLSASEPFGRPWITSSRNGLSFSIFPNQCATENI